MFEEGVRLLGQPLRRISICDVHVRGLLERGFSVSGMSYRNREVRSELADIISPGGLKQGFRCDDQCRTRAFTAADGERLDLDACFARTGVRTIKTYGGFKEGLDRLDLVFEQWGDLG